MIEIRDQQLRLLVLAHLVRELQKSVDESLTPFCVTIDHDAGAYLPYLFGPAGFCVIRKPEELPKRLPLLYVQLTRQ